MPGLRGLDPQEVELLPPALQDTYFAGCTNSPMFARYGVHGDGSCFFHSLCAGLNTSNYLQLSSTEQQKVGQRFRCKFTEHITDRRWHQFLKIKNISDKVDAETARNNFCNSKFWADETMIKYVSEVLKVNLIFIDVTTGKIYCGVRGRDEEPLIIILWIDHSHFEPVFCVRGAQLDEQLLGGQFAFDMNKNSDVVRAVFKNYEAQCSA
jgi:hypothetical protein